MKIQNLIEKPNSLTTILEDQINKPSVNPDHTILEVFNIMKKTGNYYLPVTVNNEYIGIITLMRITTRLVEILAETKSNCQRGITEIRSSLTNIQGLTSLIDESNTPEETKEITELANTCCNNAIDIMANLLAADNDIAK
jgi:signal-transduction protein with cAMP-binding, CBS, and nucleotidyltransferase domain